MIPGKHCVFAPILLRERELTLAHAQRCSFLIMEYYFGPTAVEMVPGKQEITAISAPILPRERELILSHVQRFSSLIMEQRCGPLAVEMVPGNPCDFSTKLTKRARTQSGACAEVHFPEFGTYLWSTGSRIFSKKTRRFQHLSCQESESSFCRMRRGAVS
jgi:hypothetical protein